MVDPEPRRPMASLHQNTMVNASENALPPYLQARGAKPGKGRLAMLKDDNARCCAPKTRIPTPAPKKKSRAVAVPAPAPNFVSKIPSPKSPSEMGGPPSVCTPEADHAAQNSDEHSDAGAAAASEDTAIQLAQTPDLHALPTAEVQCTDASSGEAPGSASARPYEDVPGQGTPQDFNSIMCNAGSPAGSPGPVGASTTNEQRALQAWLAARTPAAGQLRLTPGTAMLTTPHLQGLLQQLRISTPSLGAQGIACTPFLAGLDRTLPQLTPGISPEALAMFQAALPAGAMPADAVAGSRQGEAPPQLKAQVLPKEAAHSSPSATDLACPQQAPQSPEAAVESAPSEDSAAWEGLLDLSPMPGNLTMASNMAFLDSPEMDALSTLCQVSPMGSSGSRPTPVLFLGSSAVAQDATQHAPERASEPASEPATTTAQEAATAGNDTCPAALQDEESVGSASPADAAGMQCHSEVPVASDTGASGVRTRPALIQEGRQQKVVRLVSPVNPVPQEGSRPLGVGRKGRAALPKAAEVCEVINPPSVPTTPTWHSLADTAPEEAVKGAIAPANTPAGSAAKAAQPVPATNYQLMLAHIVGGQYRSPTLGQQGAQGSPPAQKGCTYTPYLLASPAGILRGGPSRFAPTRTPARTPATLRRFLATPLGARRSPARTPGPALSVGRGGLDSWLRRMGLAEVVRTPQKGGLETLWALAGQAGHLRLEVESARVAEQERSLAEAREHLEQWDYLMEHSTRLEAENAELRAELEAMLSAKLAAEAALATTAGERGVCAATANAQLALAAEEADRAKEAGLRLLELADHAALVAAAYEDEREGLRRELQATQERLAAAEAAVAAAQSATHTTTDNQLAILDRHLIAAREQHAMAGAAAAAAQEAAEQAAEEKGRLLVELEEAHATLTAAASADTDSSAASLADQLKEAHEALYEMEMAALEAQRVAQATQAALEDSEDEGEPLRIAAAAAQQQEVVEEVALAEDANRRAEEENEALRQQLTRVQEQLQAIQVQPSPSASPQVAHEPTPPKKPAESAALTGHAAAAHAAPVAFFGSHRVFLSAPATGAAPAEPEQAALTGAASASPVAVEAWCTVTDRLRRLRADLEDTSSAMHQLRSARKAPPALPMPAAAIAEEANGAIPVEKPHVHLHLSALKPAVAGAGLPEEACAGEETAPSPFAEKPSTDGSARQDMNSGHEAIQVAARADGITDSPLPIIQEESSAPEENAAEEDSVPVQPVAQDVPGSLGTAPGPDPVQLVLRIGRGFTPEPDAVAGTPEHKAQGGSRMSESPDTTPPARRPRFGLWGWRGKAISEDEEREFFRRARALNIRVSPYFRRSKPRTEAGGE